MIKMPVNVELSEVPINAMPLIDDTDFKTIKTALAYNMAGLLLYWNFVTSAGSYTQTRVVPTNTSPTSDYAFGNVGAGMYAIDIPASAGTSANNNTAGYGWFTGVATGVLPWAGPIIQFSSANIVDSLVNGTDLLDISVVQWTGTAVATPATAGIAEVNVKNINNVSSSSVTTVNANQGTTQPINFTGTGASAFAKADIVDILGTAISTPATAGILDVNVKNIDNDAASASGTVTFPNATLASTTNITAGTITTVTTVTTATNLTNAPTNGDLTATMKTSVQTAATASLTAAFLDKLVTVSGTSDSGSTTTMVDAARTEGDNDYWKGSIIVFTSGTISGQARIITDFVAATDTFTFAPATTQAVATQTYVILPGISVWDDTLAEHLAAGSTGFALNAAGSAGDPWSTAVPGAYGAGTAGLMLGTTIPAKTNLIPAAPASTTNITAGTITTVTNLTNAPTNGDLTTTMKASVNTEVDTAIADARLDELLSADSDIDGAQPPTVGSVFHELMTKTAGSFTFDQTTDSNEALRDRGDAAWTTATGFSTHTAADVWAVATRLLTAGTNIVLAKGVGVTGFNDIAAGTAMTLTAGERNAIADAAFIRAMVEAYPADGAAPTLAQLLFLMLQNIQEFSIAGTTITVKKLDGSTTAATYTLDDGTTPTSRTRAT